jgi:hypothetical protein
LGALAGLAALGFAATAAAADAPPGWSVQQANPRECVARGPGDGSAHLYVDVSATLVRFLIAAPELPGQQVELPVTLQLDDGPPFDGPGLADLNVVGFPVSGPFAALTKASRLTVTTAGHTYHFRIDGIAEAMDNAARCAHAPTLAERDRQYAPTPIAGAPDWLLVNGLPGASQACTARRNGREVDTILMVNKEGGLVLMAGRADWNAPGGEVGAALSIDGGPAEPVKVLTLTSLAFLSPADEAARTQKLRAAKTLDWTLPKGRFHADVDGLGAAFDAARACEAAKPKAASGA